MEINIPELILKIKKGFRIALPMASTGDKGLL